MDKICNLWSIKQNGFQANLLVKAGGSVMHISQIKKDGPLVFFIHPELPSGLY